MQAFVGAQVFDGVSLHRDAVLLVQGDRVAGLGPSVPPGAEVVNVPGGILAPGFVDLQVNGGGGVMVGAATDSGQLAQICAVHGRLGAMGVLPTLITDRPEVTARVLDAGIEAQDEPGFLGLHLEGPHLDPRRKGAHDAALIRPMTSEDLALYVQAAQQLPALMITLAPASAKADQVAALVAAGVVVSLGHAEATAADAQALIAAGAQSATHLFNAMSQLQGRAPGLVGAVLSSDIAAGLIADGLHVDWDSIKIACAARPEGLFLVSDCMAVAGTDLTEFDLAGRRILRREGRLTLEDGTLAGADLSLAQAVGNMVRHAGLGVERALAMATSIPARVIGRPDLGHLRPGAVADLVHLTDAFTLAATWRGGERLV
ncbi:N-acetylglucosamine-6-phosphate deacetylase [Tabrizicola sp.]|uniref:N-acetylglucosamine-6-phosphate deacetylase n=1 Tax=Tabrizicola sp. TaxID=2005166 RepID=UPI003D2CD91B